MVSSHTELVGLIAWPVGHSLSPAMHNAAFQTLGLDWVYLPLPVQSDSLESALRGLVALNFKGCNISVPHKVDAVKFLDEKSESVAVMGAVNTIKIDDGKLTGSNTDSDGFIQSIRSSGVELEGKRVFIIGAGGVARAAVYGLSKIKGVEVIIMDVLEKQALSLTNELSSLFAPNSLKFLPACYESFIELKKTVDIVINASPVGMHPKIEYSPWPDHIELPENAVFFDMVYNPIETRFLSKAASLGHKTISGVDMLVNQGAISFQVWTGIVPPVDKMREVCFQTLTTEQ